MLWVSVQNLRCAHLANYATLFEKEYCSDNVPHCVVKASEQRTSLVVKWHLDNCKATDFPDTLSTGLSYMQTHIKSPSGILPP